MKKAAVYVSFQDFLDNVFFPVQGKQKKKQKKIKTPGKDGYQRTNASGEDILKLEGNLACFLYTDNEYPELVIAGLSETDFETIPRQLSVLFTSQPQQIKEKLDDKKRSLLSFRADSYYLFSAPAVGTVHPAILVQKTAIKALETVLNSGNAPAEKDNTQASPADSWTINHPAEFIVARLFLPPRVTISAYLFTALPRSVTANPVYPQHTRHLCFKASWIFSGRPLYVHYRIDLPSTPGQQLDNLAKAVTAAFFREALAFWSSWKRPIEKPVLTACPDAPVKNSVFLVAEIRGEGQSLPCAVEFPRSLIGLAAQMVQAAPPAPASPARLLDFIRVNDALFLLMKPLYRKAFLTNPKSPVPFTGPALYGLLALMDDADKSVIIQNFLVPRYALPDLPFFFFYHVMRKNDRGEPVYRLRPAFPVKKNEIAEYLPGSLGMEWNYCMSRGCMHRVSTAENLVALNNEAVLRLAQDAAAGKLLLSEKALCILRDEILAPLQAVFRKELDDLNKHREAFAPLAKALPRLITGMLTRVDTQTLAMSCIGTEDVLAMLEKGMSRGRRAEIRAELAVVKKRVERGEISTRQLLDAKKQLIGLVQECIVEDDESAIRSSNPAGRTQSKS